MRKRIIILVSGFVQGIFFRANAQEKAKGLNLTGFVRNEEGGRVEIVAEGAEKNLEILIEWAKKGPALARVNGIEVKWEENKDEFKDFEIVY